MLISISIRTFWLKIPFFQQNVDFFHVFMMKYWYQLSIYRHYLKYRWNICTFIENINIEKLSIRKIWTYRYQQKYWKGNFKPPAGLWISLGVLDWKSVRSGVDHPWGGTRILAQTRKEQKTPGKEQKDSWQNRGNFFCDKMRQDYT